MIDDIAAKHKAPAVSIALAWVAHKRDVSSIIIGARNMKQLDENIKAADITLTAEEIAKLDDASKEASVPAVDVAVHATG